MSCSQISFPPINYDFLGVSEELYNNGIKLPDEHLIEVIEKAKGLLASEDKFFNQPKFRINDKLSFKIHYFTQPNQGTADVYICPKIENDPSFDTGAFKTKNTVCHLKIDFNENTKFFVKKSARLRPYFESEIFQIGAPEFYRKFKREVEHLERFKGTENVCQLENACEYKGKHRGKEIEKMVMYQESYDEDLCTYLNKHAIPLEKIKNIVEGCFIGLSHVHKKKLVHRDIKLENIFMKGDVPHIADFGDAKRVLSSERELIGGTALYFAPECLKQNTRQATDIWAMGVVIVALFKKKFPTWSHFIEHKVFLDGFMLDKKETLINGDEIKAKAPLLHEAFKRFDSQMLDHWSFLEKSLETAQKKSYIPINFKKHSKKGETLDKFHEIQKFIDDVIHYINFPKHSVALIPEQQYLKDNGRNLKYTFRERMVETFSTFSKKTEEIIQHHFVRLGNTYNRYSEEKENFLDTIFNPDSTLRITAEDALELLKSDKVELEPRSISKKVSMKPALSVKPLIGMGTNVASLITHSL